MPFHQLKQQSRRTRTSVLSVHRIRMGRRERSAGGRRTTRKAAGHQTFFVNEGRTKRIRAVRCRRMGGTVWGQKMNFVSVNQDQKDEWWLFHHLKWLTQTKCYVSFAKLENIADDDDQWYVVATTHPGGKGKTGVRADDCMIVESPSERCVQYGHGKQIQKMIFKGKRVQWNTFQKKFIISLKQIDTLTQHLRRAALAGDDCIYVVDLITSSPRYLDVLSEMNKTSDGKKNLLHEILNNIKNRPKMREPKTIYYTLTVRALLMSNGTVKCHHHHKHNRCVIQFVNAKDEDGNTPLEIAREMTEFVDEVKPLLQFSLPMGRVGEVKR